MARRGIPAIIMSDNAKGFDSAKKKIVATFGTDGPCWKNIAPLSPWWGGWWEIGFNIFPKPNFPGNTSREDQFPGNSREIPGNLKFVKYYLFLAENEVYVRN